LCEASKRDCAPTVKRDLSRGKFSLERLDKICEVLGVEVNDLIQPADSSPLTELSDEQEQALVANPKLLLVTYLVINDWKFNEIVSTFQIDENELGEDCSENGPTADCGFSTSDQNAEVNLAKL
jgi:hypothetical protein